MVFVLGVPYAKKKPQVRFVFTTAKLDIECFLNTMRVFGVCEQPHADRACSHARQCWSLLKYVYTECICLAVELLYWHSCGAHLLSSYNCWFFFLCFSSSYNTKKIPSRSYITNFIVYAGELAFMRSLVVIGTPMEKWWCSSNMCVCTMLYAFIYCVAFAILKNTKVPAAQRIIIKSGKKIITLISVASVHA